MRTKILLGLLIVVVFSAGVLVGTRFGHAEKKIELHMKFDRQSGFVTAYTFYRDHKGDEVKHGDLYEFDVSGKIDVRQRFEDGAVVSGRGRFN